MIDPLVVSTARVGELPVGVWSLTDKLPHEIGVDLHQGTVQGLADLIGGYLGSIGGLSFNPTTVTDGQTLPSTTTNEWMLVGKGTFVNVGGAPNITTTEELNALTSNGSYWSLAVEIPIDVELSGITQNIRSGYTDTVPSEDAVFKALAEKLNVDDLPEIPAFSLIESIDFVVTVASTQEFVIPSGKLAFQVFINGSSQWKSTVNNLSRVDTWTQSSNTVTLNKPTVINNYIVIFYQ